MTTLDSKLAHSRDRCRPLVLLSADDLVCDVLLELLARLFDLVLHEDEGLGIGVGRPHGVPLIDW